MSSFYAPGATTFTATNGGQYTIVAYGAQGGAGGARSSGGNEIAGGLGAEAAGTFTLTAGEVLTIVVGGVGTYSYNNGGGGGGGSFVIETTAPGGGAVHVPLLIAGGGGGGGTSVSAADAGQAGQATAVNGDNPGTGGAAPYGGGGGGYGGGLPGTSTTAGGTGYAATAKPLHPYAGGTQSGPAYSNGGYGGGGEGAGGGGGGGGYGGGTGGSNVGTGPGSNTATRAYTGGTGGGSLDTGTSQTLATSVRSGSGGVIVTAVPLCFLRGTRILTPTGETRIEDLAIGNPVVTRFGGIQPIKWIGRHSHAPGCPETSPVCIHAGALGDRLPARDLFVSPGHSLLVNGTLLIAKLLINGLTVTQDWCPPRIDYLHIELASHDCIIAEGTWAETYADAQTSRATFDNAPDYDRLYPDDGPAPDAFALCAPRPERGAKLEAALRPVVARIDLTPGPLQGSIDQIDGAWRVHGWAHDATHPLLPVLLDVELDGRVIGTIAACEAREDLARAGLGRCAFTFTSPIRLRPDLLPTLRIRRQADRAPLTMDPRCTTTVAAPPGVRLVA